jgi:hypothetical protein
MIIAPSCEIETIENPNGPTIEALTTGASLVDLQLLASGLESVMRNDVEFYYWTTSIVGREYWDLRGTDPRYTGELMGAQGAALDNNGFLTTRSFSARYKAIRNAYILEEAVANSEAGLTDAEKNGFTGLAKTLRAYSLLMVLNRQYENGCRLDTRDPDNLGAFVSYTEGLAGVMSLLDEAAGELAGASFAFTSSYADDAATLRAQNRAIAARVALYQGNNALALTLLGDSFYDINGDLNMGMSYKFGAGGNDRFNPVYVVPNQDRYFAHPTFITDAEAGDQRVDNKTADFGSDITLDGLTGRFQTTIFASNTSPIYITRNEELVLIYAEANIGTDNTETVNAINVVRANAGLAAYAGGTDDASLLDEVLHQRRYSLFGEGHRWIDMRRNNRLGDLPIDRTGDVVHTQFPRPVLEQ